MSKLQLIYDQVLGLDLLPLLLAAVLGGLVGLERELHGRPAGLRTHILVCVASTLLILAAHQIHPLASTQPGGATLVFDPTRLAAGVVTGIGFLGAGTVLRSGDMVRGITTGACIWCMSAVGVAIGFQAYGLAVATTCIVLMVLVFLDQAERWLSPVIYRKLTVRGEYQHMTAVEEAVNAILKGAAIRTQALSVELDAPAATFEFVYNVRCRNRLQGPGLLENIVVCKGVDFARWT